MKTLKYLSFTANFFYINKIQIVTGVGRRPLKKCSIMFSTGRPIGPTGPRLVDQSIDWWTSRAKKIFRHRSRNKLAGGEGRVTDWSWVRGIVVASSDVLKKVPGSSRLESKCRPGPSCTAEPSRKTEDALADLI